MSIKYITCPNTTSETSTGLRCALKRLSLITILPKSDAFSDDKEPQKDPKINKIFYRTWNSFVEKNFFKFYIIWCRN